MSTVRSIASDALMEIGVLGQGETMGADDGALALLRIQTMIDAWAADRNTQIGSQAQRATGYLSQAQSDSRRWPGHQIGYVPKAAARHHRRCPRHHRSG